jgi:hypothetical protein
MNSFYQTTRRPFDPLMAGFSITIDAVRAVVFRAVIPNNNFFTHMNGSSTFHQDCAFKVGQFGHSYAGSLQFRLWIHDHLNKDTECEAIASLRARMFAYIVIKG